MKLSEKEWDLVLEVKYFCDKLNFIPPTLFVFRDKDVFKCSDILIPKLQVLLKIDIQILSDSLKVEFLNPTPTNIDNIKYYLYYAMNSLRAIKNTSCQIIAHFAQSLDGNIATRAFDSKWIGNEANLIHAHRMRALNDGILVGANTAYVDKPQLTTRLVKGKNPKKFVFATKDQNLNVLEGLGFQNICTDASCESHIKLENIASYLFNIGIKSLYVEGGPKTTALFIERGLVDILQLHIAPIVIGGGISSMPLKPIDKLKDALQFENTHFINMDGHIMFEGRKLLG